MKFPYTSFISESLDSDDFLVLERPEVPLTLIGPGGVASYVGLIDTGSDNTIFPKSAADYLRIPLTPARSPDATVFGGQRLELLIGEAILRLDADGESVAWKTLLCFFDFSSRKDETVLLGIAGFLQYFTATLDGKHAMLTLLPNDEMPLTF